MSKKNKNSFKSSSSDRKDDVQVVSDVEKIDPQSKNKIIALHKSGPLPSPHDFAAYGKVVKNAPERILKMAENRAEMVNKLENESIKADMLHKGRGQVFAFSIAILGMVIGGILGYLHANPVIVVVIAGFPLVLIVWSFLKK